MPQAGQRDKELPDTTFHELLGRVVSNSLSAQSHELEGLQDLPKARSSERRSAVDGMRKGRTADLSVAVSVDDYFYRGKL
jgi:hypothetical protein